MGFCWGARGGVEGMEMGISGQVGMGIAGEFRIGGVVQGDDGAGLPSIFLSAPEIIHLPESVDVVDRAENVPAVHVELHETKVVLSPRSESQYDIIFAVRLGKQTHTPCMHAWGEDLHRSRSRNIRVARTRYDSNGCHQNLPPRVGHC